MRPTEPARPLSAAGIELEKPFHWYLRSKLHSPSGHIERPTMFLERLLALATGAIVALCLGLGLVMMALGPGRKIAEPAHIAEPTHIAETREAPLAEAASEPAPEPADPRPSARAPASPPASA